MNINYNKMLTNDEIQSIYDMCVDLYHDLKYLVVIMASITL